MNKRRLSYGLLVTFAAAAFVVGCGDSTPEATTPPQPTAAASADPAPAATVAEVAPPPAPTPPPEPPPPPPKPAKDKFAGKFVQDFSGAVADAAEADAVKKAGAKDKDGKKHDAAIAKAKAAVALNTLETASDGLTWSVKGKPAHTIKFEIVGGDEKSVTVKFVKDGKKDIKPPVEVAISVTDDTISFTDPFAKKKDSAMTLVFKRQ
jgi:flagellar hook-basal body complex protein FliE